MTGRLLKIGVPLAILALVVAAFAAQAPQKMAELEALKPIAPTYTQHQYSRYNVPKADADQNGGWEPDVATSARSNSILDDKKQRPSVALQATVPNSPGIVLCGAAAGGTTYDYHHNDDPQQMIATLADPAGSFVHFAWTNWDRIPDSLEGTDRYTNYNCYDPVGGLGLGNCGYTFQNFGGSTLEQRSGFPTLDVGTGDVGYIALHARNDANQPSGNYSTWIETGFGPCFNSFGVEEFPASTGPEAIWPHLRIDVASPEDGGVDVFHICSHPTGDHPPFDNEVFYWRRVGGFGNSWEGPVVLDQNAGLLNYHVAVNPVGQDVAVFYERDDLEPIGLLQVGYVESPDNGASWILAGQSVTFPAPVAHDDYVFITNYLGPEGDSAQAWLECQGEYDLGGRLHCVFSEQVFSNQTADCRIRHWDEVNGTRTLKQAIGWDNQGGVGGRDIWLADPGIGFGDGSTTCTDGPGDQTNTNYVYVTYQQYGGPSAVEQNDVSASDNYQNLDFYLSISNDRGNTFSPSVNLTNTKSPGCDGRDPDTLCASERDQSLAHIINDTIHIEYILDRDAGDAVFGQGYWTYNPVMYLRIPGGTDNDTLCPEIAPVFAVQLTNQDPDCEYHAGLTVPPLQQNEKLIIENFGNADLVGSVNENPPVDWLDMTGGSYTIVPASGANVRNVIMDATAASVTAEGLYQTTIEVFHNDGTLADPQVLPVDFFVFDEFYCPEYVVLNTGWLWLEVSNVERQSNQSDTDGGLSRNATDSSYSVYDASLIIGRPPYEFDPDHAGEDTIVYRNIFGRGNGQPGFRALGNLIVDTSAYGTGAGKATATARQTTSDSTLGVDVEYIFPQAPDSCEFVLIKYKVYNRTASTITGLAVGQATDFDVTPSLHDVDSLQPGSQNTGHIPATSGFNLLYQQGVDTAGYTPVGNRTATRFKAGITAIQCFPAPRGWIAPNDPWLFENPGGGWHEDYLWTEMTKNTGFELFPPNQPDPEEDLHTAMVFEQNVDLAPNDVKHYLMAYVSSNSGTGDGDETDLINTTKKAWKYCFGWQEFVELDSLPAATTSASYPYYAIGSYEGGLNSGCCGCEVTRLSGPGQLSVVGGEPGDCSGTIQMSNPLAWPDVTFTATFRIATPCGGYFDDCELTVVVGAGGAIPCDCPFQGDINEDHTPDALDLNDIIDVLFFGGTNIKDPSCPTFRADLNNDGVPDALDLNFIIDQLFFGGPVPCDPCNPQGPPNCAP